LADAFDCMVLVDEAHGTGVLGQTGAGLVAAAGCHQRPLIQMGTLSKALGSLGGYVTGPANLIDYLRNRARSWIYTTALTPAAAAAALAAIQIVQAEPQRRDRLWQNVQHLKRELTALIPTASAGNLFRLLPSDSPIVCVAVPDAATVVHWGQRLLTVGCLVSAVRPPTVPVSRLRMTVMATHQPDHIQQLIGALQQISTEAI
ncbi:MAG: aminotransferase class I/II-fold pyridoxal phosphate-dependent enzyme, partial [Cyanobacteria bacterium P01_D01_bin.71]